MFVENTAFNFCDFLSNTVGLSSMERHGIMELCKILGCAFYFWLRINDEKSHGCLITSYVLCKGVLLTIISISIREIIK